MPKVEDIGYRERYNSRYPDDWNRMNKAAARIFASHYQLVVCTDPKGFTEETNWGPGDKFTGFAGNEYFKMIGTEAHLNDHWVEVEVATDQPDLEPWHRVTCVRLQCDSGFIHVMSVMDAVPPISLEVPKGKYAAYVATCNLGIDQNSLGEEDELSDEELARRKDVEWYRIFLVPGSPPTEGRIKDVGHSSAG